MLLVRAMISTGLSTVAILTLALLTGWMLIAIMAVPPIVAVAATLVVAWLAVRLAQKRSEREMPPLIDSRSSGVIGERLRRRGYAP